MQWITAVAEWMAPRAKAVLAAAAAFVMGIQAYNGGGITVGEWAEVILATMAAGGVVYAVPNRPSKTTKPEESS